MTGNDIKIAVIEEQLRGIREQNAAQAERTQELLRKLFDEVDDLKQAMSRGKGIFAASLTFAGIIGGAISVFIQWMLSRNT